MITIHLNPCNPGQFFACCGFLELASRMWQGTVGWFETTTRFVISDNGEKSDPKGLLKALIYCDIYFTNEPTIEALSSKKDSTKQEKQQFKELKDTTRMHLRSPFDIWIDWWDSHSRCGGREFKTWSGKQNIITLVRNLKTSLKGESVDGMPFREILPKHWLTSESADGSSHLYFDSSFCKHRSPRDYGFSLNQLKFRSYCKPIVEIVALIGLQRFRPLMVSKLEGFEYCLWREPLSPLVASLAIINCNNLGSEAFRFKTTKFRKYKSFCTASNLT